MKKHLSFLSALSFLCFTATAQNRSINFEHSSFAEIKAKAKKENKLIFVDAFTTWCGPCKQMAKTIFTNDTVADFYNSQFINAKIDMEKGEGIDIAKRYQVSCYPTLLFIDGDGNIAHRSAGSMPVAAFINVGKKAKDTNANFAWYVKNYEAKKADAAFVMEYIELIDGTCQEPGKVLDQYFSLQKESELMSANNWKMISNYTNSIDSREFKFLLANQAKFNEQYGEKEVSEKIKNVAHSSLNTFFRSNTFDETAYHSAKEKILKMNIPSANEIIFEADLSLAKRRKEWASYIRLALANVDLYYSKKADELNNIAWTFYESVEDKAALLKAETWAKQAVSLDASYANMDTYAAVLYKNGKKEEALAAADKAIEQAKKENYSAEDYSETSELIKKIKAMK